MLQCKMRLMPWQGLFDPPEGQPDYSDPSLVGSKFYHKLSLDASRQAMTLLSNHNNTLPLSPGGRIAVWCKRTDANSDGWWNGGVRSNIPMSCRHMRI